MALETKGWIEPMTWIEPLVGRVPRWRLLRGVTFLAAGLIFTAPTFGLLPPLVFRNDGPSAPEGYYVYAHHPPAVRGEIVVVRDPPHFNLPWLMKTVAGVAGDIYCWDPALGTQRLNGRLMPPPHPLAVELKVPIWRGCATLKSGELIGYGRSADSYDSRYLGPVHEAKLWGVYRPLWVER